ncbi:hypothetical protein [Cryptosporangium arvum]|uniref:hypothetical protein n=1 Tax=Cryptosporangium arvum TaxID=80871 RepID=UPI0004B7AA23|nr:hypothetical protein [Cryptosporangium arvum]
MTDDPLDRLIRDADPYRPVAGERLDGAAEELLEEIVSDRTVRTRPARRRFGPLIGAGVAAAALVGVVALTGTDAPEPAGRPSDATTVTYSALALKAAEENPRLLIDEPGWTATYVNGFAAKEGSITWSKQGREVEFTWRPAQYYDSYQRDRADVSAAQPVTVAGRSGQLFTYAANDFAVMLPPSGSSFVEMRASGPWTRDTFSATLAHVVQVGVSRWLAALPPEVVTPDRISARAEEVLAGVPLPPGFDRAALAGLGTNDAYQFGAQVASRVGCGWIAEWERATGAGDTAAVARAADALRGSHGWKFLNDMNAAGDYPEVFWEIADEVVGGSVPEGYRDSLGC